MKKALLVVMVLAMVLSLVACGGSIEARLDKVEKGMKAEDAIKILGKDYKEIAFGYDITGKTYIVYEQKDNKAAVVYTEDDEVDSAEWVEDYAQWEEDMRKDIAQDLDGEEIEDITAQEAIDVFGDDYEELTFEHKYKGESFFIYDKGDNEAIIVYAKDDEVASVQWVEDYALWRETADVMIADDTAGMEISVDTFFERYNEIIKEYDYDFLKPISKSDFNLTEVEMTNVDYAYEYYYNVDEYTLTYYTDEEGRMLDLIVTRLVDLDKDVDASVAEHSDVLDIATRAVIGRAVKEARLDEVLTIEDYGVFHTYSGRFYGISIRHTDTY